tara:strand:- start:828 stop:1112 length:285 start_codon:yes stop_codon:yes gene_type:complete
MDELMDAMATDESPSQISDKIKEILFQKSAERIDAFKTDVANGVFGDGIDVDDEEEIDDEVVDETDDEIVDEVDEDEVEAEDDTEVTAELEDQQ